MDFKTLHSAEWLQYKVLDNRVLDYLLAACIFFGIWLLLAILKKVAKNRGKSLVARFGSAYEQFFSDILARINPSFIPLLSLYISIHRLKIADSFEKFLDIAITMAVLIQILSLATMVSDFLIGRMKIGDGKTSDLAVRSTRKNISLISRVAIWILGFLFLLSNFGINISTFVTGLGIGGLAVGPRSSGYSR